MIDRFWDVFVALCDTIFALTLGAFVVFLGSEYRNRYIFPEMLKTWNILPERFKLNYYYNNITTLLNIRQLQLTRLFNSEIYLTLLSIFHR